MQRNPDAVGSGTSEAFSAATSLPTSRAFVMVRGLLPEGSTFALSAPNRRSATAAGSRAIAWTAVKPVGLSVYVAPPTVSQASRPQTPAAAEALTLDLLKKRTVGMHLGLLAI